jgi:outer membrane protein assembly factor BamB
MMRRGAPYAALALAALSLTACNTVSRLNPFHGRSHQTHAEPGERISLLELNDQLKVSESLKGQDFFLPPPESRADWPLPGGSAEQSVEHVAAGADLTIAWRRTFGEAENRARHVTAPPIVAENKVFVMDGMANVSAHDAETGAQLWRVNLEPKSKREKEGFGGGLAYQDGKVYATSGFRLVAQIDAKSGRVDWLTHTDSPIHAAPTVADGKVIVVDVDDQLLTFNTADGTPSWNYEALAEPARVLSASSPAVFGDTVVASFASGELAAFRASNGQALWDVQLSGTTPTSALSEIRDIAGRPVIYKGDVFAISHANVMAATDLRTGAIRWEIPLSGVTSPWVAGDVVYAVGQTGLVVCVSRDSGQLYWLTDLDEPLKTKKGKTPKRQRLVWTTPILASGRLITFSDKGEGVALDPKTGQVLKRLKIGDDALIGPIAAGNLIYLATEKADLIAIR